MKEYEREALVVAAQWLEDEAVKAEEVLEISSARGIPGEWVSLYNGRITDLRSSASVIRINLAAKRMSDEAIRTEKG